MERYAAIVRSFSGDARVTPPEPPGTDPPRFGANCLRVDGRIFAFLQEDRFVVKLSSTRVDELVSTAGAERFSLRRDRRPMREWAAVGNTPSSPWDFLAREAYEYVAGASGPPRRAKSGRRLSKGSR